MKKVIIMILVILVIIVSCFIYVFYLKDNKSNISDLTINEKPSKEIIKADEDKENNLNDNQNNDKDINIKENENNDSIQEQPSTNKNDKIINKSEKNENISSNSISEDVTTPSKELKEWEKLGISEYDYYNSPAWEWQTVDFGINLDESKYCSNENDCLLKCQEYGNEYLQTHSGGFKCNNVVSYSGKYLGEDFEFFELQP